LEDPRKNATKPTFVSAQRTRKPRPNRKRQEKHKKQKKCAVAPTATFQRQCRFAILALKQRRAAAMTTVNAASEENEPAEKPRREKYFEKQKQKARAHRRNQRKQIRKTERAQGAFSRRFLVGSEVQRQRVRSFHENRAPHQKLGRDRIPGVDVPQRK